MRRHPLAAPFLAMTLALAASLPVAGLADDGGAGGEPAPAQDDVRVEAATFLERLFERDRRPFKIGTLDVEVSVVPDYFMVLVAREVLRVEGRTAEQLRADLQRLAGRTGKKAIGKLGVRVYLRHTGRGDRNYYAFQGGIDGRIRVNAAGNLPLTVGAYGGDLEQVELTLFRASRSPVFAAEGNCPPVMRRRVSRLGEGAFWIELVARRDPSPRAEALEVGVGGFIHFSGGGIAGQQVDFDNGATAVIEPSTPASFPLPLAAHPVPPGLAAVMPTIPD